MQATLRLWFVAIALAFFVNGTADAGAEEAWPVSIDIFGRTATGSLGSARAGLGAQYIGCWMGATGVEDNGGDAVYHSGCWARNWYGLTVSCNFPDIPATSATLPPIFMTSSDALLSFKWDANAVCTELKTSVYGSLRPKTH